MATTKLTGTLIRTGSIPTIALGSGVVTSSAQIVNLIPTGTVSSSAQINTGSFSGSITSASYALTASYVANAVVGSGVVSSSTQFKTLTDPFTGSFTGSFNGAHTGSILAAGVVSSSAQYPGWVTSSTQVVWSSVNYNAGIVSSSAQVQPLLPGGTVSSSAQYPGWVTASSQVQLNALTGTTFSNAAFYFPSDLIVANNLTTRQLYTKYVSSSVIYESGSSKFGDTTDDVMSVTGSIQVLGGSISGSMVGMFSASSQVVWSSVNYNAGIMSSSAQTVANISGQYIVPSGSNYQGIVSGSGQQYRLIVPVGTNLYAT